jgi:phage protein D
MPISSTDRVKFAVKFDGREVPDSAIHAVTVHSSLDQADVATLRLPINTEDDWVENVHEGADVQIMLGLSRTRSDDDTIFTGKIVRVQALYSARTSGRSVTFVAYNRLHEMTRVAKTNHYTHQTDKQIIEQVARRYHMEVRWDREPSSVPDSAFQHNESDWRFVTRRLSRMNYQMRCVTEGGKTQLALFPRSSRDAGLTLKLGAQSDGDVVGMTDFHPHLSTAHQVSVVKVYGWDDARKERICGQYPRGEAPAGMGARTGHGTVSSLYPDQELVHHDIPVQNRQEADSCAQSIFEERQMGFVTATARTEACSLLMPGMTVKVDLDAQLNKKFSGDYFIKAITHRFTEQEGATTELELASNAHNGESSSGGSSTT